MCRGGSRFIILILYSSGNDTHRNPAIGMPRPETHSETSSSVRERLVFIDFRCTFLGELRRADLREIVPVAFADNGLRWHVRAYDRRGKRFVDFVLTRIHTVEDLPSSTIEPHELAQHDLDGSRVLELELVAHPKETHPEIIAMDYDMQQGVLKIRVRAALASYLLRQWLVDCTPTIH
jgi:hypothetical protein